MAPSQVHIFASVLLLTSLAYAQRGDYSSHCVPQDEFGTYCPTTCGVVDYLHKYKPAVEEDLKYMEDILEDIANATTGAQEKVDYMKDQATQAQKTSQDVYIKKSNSMLEDIIRYEKTIVSQEEQLMGLQSILDSNTRDILTLRQLSLQLEQKCKEPCAETVQIQETITGKDKVGGVPVFSGTQKVLALAPDLTSCNAEDCQDVANRGAKVSGLYYVKPDGSEEEFLVYCEIDNEGRGWTVLQRRRDGSVDFKRNWIPYKEGFGYLSPDDTTEFWLGLEKIHKLSVQSNIPYVLRIEVVDWNGVKKHADYSIFKLGSEQDMYRLTYAYYSGGDAGDAFDGYDFGDDPSDKYFTSHNGQQFSTPDKDNDRYDGNCAQQDGAGWWMNRCHAANLNGVYYQGGHYTEKDVGEGGFDNGITWVTWHSRWYSMKETTMKILPLSALHRGGQQFGPKTMGDI